MIVLYETHAIGKTHVPFNAGLIKIVATAYPGQDIRFYASAGHLEEVRKHCPRALQLRIGWKSLDIPDKRSRYFSYAIQTYRSLKKIKQETPEKSLLLLSLIIPASLIAVKIFHRFSKHFPAIQIVLHGQLAEIIGWQPRNPWLRLQSFRTSLKYLNKQSLNYIVLEKAIGAELKVQIPALADHIHVLPHPIPDNSAPLDKDDHQLDIPVTIGFLGLVTAMKGFPIFLDLARKTKEISGHKVRFVAIGHTQGKPLPEGMDCLDVKPQTSYLTRETFIALVKQCHYICLPFKGNHYRLSASGTLLDAIAWKKPVIALNVPMVEDLFKEYGDIGCLCRDETEMVVKTAELVHHQDKDRYICQRAAITHALEARLPPVLAKKYHAFTHELSERYDCLK